MHEHVGKLAEFRDRIIQFAAIDALDPLCLQPDGVEACVHVLEALGGAVHIDQENGKLAPAFR